MSIRVRERSRVRVTVAQGMTSKNTMKRKYKNKCVIHVHRNKLSYVGRLTVNVYERALYTLQRCFKNEELFTCRSITLHLELILLQEPLVLCLKTCHCVEHEQKQVFHPPIIEHNTVTVKI